MCIGITFLNSDGNPRTLRRAQKVNCPHLQAASSHRHAQNINNHETRVVQIFSAFVMHHHINQRQGLLHPLVTTKLRFSFVVMSSTVAELRLRPCRQTAVLLPSTPAQRLAALAMARYAPREREHNIRELSVLRNYLLQI